MTPWARRLAMVGLVFVAGATWSAVASVEVLLEQAEAIKLTEHARFASMLAQIHQDAPVMTPAQRWHLRFLDAWETQFVGKNAEARVLLQDIIDHSGDTALAARSTGLLLSNLSITRHYDEAYVLARHAVAMLDGLMDRTARYTLLANLSQTLNFAGQPAIALKYARMMADDIPDGETICRSISLDLAARYNTGKLRSDDPQFKRGTDDCDATGQTVIANSIWLNLSTVLIDEHKDTEGLALLDRLQASVERNGYFLHKVSWMSQRAVALADLRRDDEAREAALATTAMFKPGDIDMYAVETYKVLYEVARRAGRMDDALAYYQEYARQDRGYLDDMGQRAAAYEAAEQRIMVQALEAKKLASQNTALELEQSIATKAVEATRLYIALMVVALLSLGIWLYRVKRAQVHFRWLSNHDGLTGVSNHRHFMDQLDATLRDLDARAIPACLVLLDLDHFKRINDTHGHAAGDIVLRHAVAACEATLRPGERLGRLGGEEFGVLLPGCLPEEGLARAEAMRAAIAGTPVEVDGVPIPCSTSVGLASTWSSGHDPKRLRQDADAALYRAKRAGRNRVVQATFEA